MKLHTSKYFPQLLQTASFFTYNIKPWQSSLPECIKLMNVNQLFMNIMNDKFETVLMKQIIKFLVFQICNSDFYKRKSSSVCKFLIGDLEKYRGQLIQDYYMQMALQQYFCLTNQQQNIQQYVKIFNFYEINTQLKYNLLTTLINYILSQICPKQQKNRKEQQKANNNTKKAQNQQDAFSQILLLGQDHKKLYFFASFIKQYVLTFYQNQWDILNKNLVIKTIKQILKKPKCANLLFLAQNLSTIQKKYMIEQIKPEPIPKLHKIKQNPHKKQQQILFKLKQKMLNINNRYNIYLHNFDKRCWGYLKQRQNYVFKVKDAKNIDQLIQALKQFYLVSHAKIFRILALNQENIPEEKCHQFYSSQIRHFCNINTVYVKIGFNISVTSQDLCKKIIEEQHADLYPLFYMNIIVLQLAVKNLQKKAQKYYQKQKKLQEQKQKQKQKPKKIITNENMQADNNRSKRILRNKPERHNLSQFSLSESSISVSLSKQMSKNQNKNVTRQTRKKKYGVTMLDSDQSSSQQFKCKSDNFDKYNYQGRNIRK